MKHMGRAGKVFDRLLLLMLRKGAKMLISPAVSFGELAAGFVVWVMVVWEETLKEGEKGI